MSPSIGFFQLETIKKYWFTTSVVVLTLLLEMVAAWGRWNLSLLPLILLAILGLAGNFSIILGALFRHGFKKALLKEIRRPLLFSIVFIGLILCFAFFTYILVPVSAY